MFKNLINKLTGNNEDENNNIVLKSPLTGKVLHISKTPDDVFAEKMLGDGVAIEPTEGVVYSPVDGEITQIFLPSKHALGITSKDGLEILIHIGLETVKMNGEGFEALVKQGDKVKEGQELIRFDIQKIKEKAKSTITPVLITNMHDIKGLKVIKDGNIEAKEDLIIIQK
jgi:glucose-specific phosphotransferase system IIA component